MDEGREKAKEIWELLSKISFELDQIEKGYKNIRVLREWMKNMDICIILDKWDLIIAHPPCTYLSNAATRSHSLKGATLEQINARTEKRIQAQEFFMKFANVNCEKVAIENPVGVMSTVYRKPDQIIEPYQFAESKDDTENYLTKRTCLWLKGLKPLQGNNLDKPNNAELYGRWSNGKAGCWHEVQGQKNKATVRSKTFPGIAKAMAEQWGIYD